MSADMADALRGLGDEVSTWQEAVREMRLDFGGKTADVLAAAFDVTRRSAERWLAFAEGRTSQRHDPTKRHPARAAALIDLMKNRRAAKKLRAVRQIKAGKVRVIDKSPKKGGRLDPRPRNLGTRPVSGELATAREAAADLVASGEYERAAAVLDEGLLESYGAPDVLEIDSYLSPPEFE